MNAELIADCRCALAENPLWHDGERRLYFTDIDNRIVYRLDPLSGAYEAVYQGETIGGFTLQSDGSLLLFGDKGKISVLRGDVISTIVDEIPGESGHRFNDVIADPAGRVFAGTICNEGRSPGRLYRIDYDAQFTAVVDNVGCSNGMGFTADLTTMYYTDSEAREIYAFDYDSMTSGIGNRRVFASIADKGASPDGMTVDTEGGVWSALWGGYGVVRLNEDGKQDMRIDVATSHVTSVVFGGDTLEDLFITTAGGYGPEKGKPGAGGIFVARPGVKGRDDFRSRITG